MALANHATVLVILALSVVFGVVFVPKPALTKKELLRGLDALSQEPRTLEAPPAPRVVVLFNGCVDLVTEALPVLDAVVPIEMLATPAANSASVISSESELIATFREAFAQGAACERVVTNPALFAKLRAAAEARAAVATTGGNAALISTRLARDGSRVMLGAPVGVALREKLHPRVTAINIGAGSSDDDIHLILEYGAGAQWERTGALKAPRANRFIVTETAPALDDAALDSFLKKAVAFKPTLVVLSGIHLLEAMPDAAREVELRKVDGAVTQLRGEQGNMMDGRGLWRADGQGGPKIHLELASLADLDFAEAVLTRLLQDLKVDSLGLNEQELAHTYCALNGPVSALPAVVKKGKGEGRLNPLKLVRRLKAGAKALLGKAKAAVLTARGGDAVEVDAAAAAATAAAEAAAAEADAAGGAYAARLNASDAARLELLTGKSPSVEAVVTALTHIFDFAGESLGRIHYHSLAYHIIAVRASHVNRWPDAAAAVARGAVASTLQACDVNESNPEGLANLHGDALTLIYQQLSGLVVRGVELPRINASSPVAVWHDFEYSEVQFALAPVLVCKEPIRTVGLGDTISGAAMHRHLAA